VHLSIRIFPIVGCALLTFVLVAQETAPKPVEFGDEVNHVSVSLSLPDRADEGRWVFDVTAKNTDTKKNRNMMLADRPQGWQWEIEETGSNPKKYAGSLTSRPPPFSAKYVYLAPGESKSFRVSVQTAGGATRYFEIPPGTYRIRLSCRPVGDGEAQSQIVYSNWKEFKIDAEGTGPDAPHREFPHISAGLGGKLSVADKPAGPFAFDMTLRNFANLPTELYLQAMTGFSLEFQPVGDDKTLYRAEADYEKPDEKTPAAVLAKTSKAFAQQLRASLEATRIEPKGTRTFKLDVLTPWTAGPLRGKWTLTQNRKNEKSEVIPALPPGRYRVRAFFDPASTLDSVVSIMPLGEAVWRGMAVSNEIEVDLPLKATKLSAK
jgi:hypothetical protein